MQPTSYPIEPPFLSADQLLVLIQASAECPSSPVFRLTRALESIRSLGASLEHLELLRSFDKQALRTKLAQLDSDLSLMLYMYLINGGMINFRNEIVQEKIHNYCGREQ